MGDKGRQDPREGRHAIQQRETDRGDKTLRKADTPSNNGKQEGVRGKGETRASDIQQRETRRGTMGEDKRRQDPRQGGHTIQQRESRRGTTGDKRRQDPQEGGHTIQQGEKMGDKGRPDPCEGGGTIQQRETRRETRGDKGR